MNDPAAGDPALVARGFRAPSWPWRAVLALWLPTAVAATLSAGTVEVAVQQSLRRSADDPQIQVAEDIANALSAGAAPRSQVGTTPVDLSRSLALNIIVLDDRQTVLVSTAQLDGALPRPPAGALSAASATSPNIVTWQPRPDIRQAAVIATWNGPGGRGTVVAARSLREVEQREDLLMRIVIAGWLTALAGAAGAAALAVRLRRRDDDPSGPAATT